MRAHIREHTDKSTEMKAHIWKHRDESTQMRAHRCESTQSRTNIWEHTYESTHTHMTAHIWEHTYMKAQILSTHMRAQRKAHISEHSGEHTSEPAQPRSRGTSHKSHFVWKFTGKMPDPKPKRVILCGNVQEKCRTRIPRPAFYMEIDRKKRTWEGHKSHFLR